MTCCMKRAAVGSRFVSFSNCLDLLSSAGIVGGRRLWPRVFTHDWDVVNVAATLLHIVAVSSSFDGFNCIFRGMPQIPS